MRIGRILTIVRGAGGIGVGGLTLRTPGGEVLGVGDLHGPLLARGILLAPVARGSEGAGGHLGGIRATRHIGRGVHGGAGAGVRGGVGRGAGGGGAPSTCGKKILNY